jgi:hypothetical protein
MTAGFLDSDEKTAFGSAGGFLCSGNHPGIGEQPFAYFAMTTALGLGFILVEKFTHWRSGGFTHF